MKRFITLTSTLNNEEQPVKVNTNLVIYFMKSRDNRLNSVTMLHFNGGAMLLVKETIEQIELMIESNIKLEDGHGPGNS